MKRSARRLAQAAHLARCGGRAVLDAWLDVERDRPLDGVLETSSDSLLKCSTPFSITTQL
jgi:hypothetical protein